jgi:hypothetical protein
MDTATLSFGAQAFRYFERAHEGVPREPIEAAAAWRGSDLAGRDDWIVTLDASQIAELESAGASARARGLGAGDFDADAFPLPGLAAVLAGIRDELSDGRGFVLLRGLPVARWGDEHAARIYWGVGAHLGTPGAQNPDGDVLGHVYDTGEDAGQPFVRRYRTAGDIAYHCDLADVVGLLCLRTARRGGASRIASSVSVYNELLRRRPDLVDRLFEPFLLDSRDEQKSERPPYIPVPPCRFADGRLSTFYHSDYFRSAQRHPGVPPFTDDERTLLDLYESIAASPELRLDMQLEPGDIQLISNHVILHARTAYEDDASDGGRHLLRLWLSL